LRPCLPVENFRFLRRHFRHSNRVV
jgi:hypothetical protein